MQHFPTKFKYEDKETLGKLFFEKKKIKGLGNKENHGEAIILKGNVIS